MKVILVQAPARNLRFNIGGYFNILPLGIAYLARTLKDKDISFAIFYPRSREVCFVDPTFTIDQGRTRDLCEAMIRKNIGLVLYDPR